MTDVSSGIRGVRPTAETTGQTTGTVDLPPLWTPHDEQVFRRAALTPPPSAVEGWTVPRRIVHFFFGSFRSSIARVGLAVGVLFFATTLPTLAGYSDWGNLARVAWYHGWTLAVLTVVSTRIRALPAHRLLTFALLGASAGALAVYYLSGPIADLTSSENPTVWVNAPLEEVVKLLLVTGVLLGAKRQLRQPGVFDFALLGYAVGAGYSFHEDALWGRVTTTGFESPWGLLFPSFFQPEGLLVLGHAGWTAVAAIGLGLVVMHWRRPVWAVTGAAMIFVPIVDHMAVNSRDGSFDWVLDVLFDHKVSAWLLLGGLVLGFALDLGVLRSTAARDHLLTKGRFGARRGPGRPAGEAVAVRRMHRAVNGVHFARHRDRAIWPPPRPEATTSTLVVLGRTARAAGHPVGPQADRGWDLDPIDPSRARWFTDDGWTPYVVGPEGIDLDQAPGRPDAVGVTRADPPANWITMVGLFASLIAAVVVVRLLTVPDEAPGGFQFGSPTGAAPPRPNPSVSSLPDAPNGPPGRMFGAGAGGFGNPGPGTGPGAGTGPAGDPPPLPPDFFDGTDGPPGPDDAPPGDPPPQEDDCK